MRKFCKKNGNQKNNVHVCIMYSQKTRTFAKS